MLRGAALIASCAAVVSACKKPVPREETAAYAVEKISEFKDRMCLCKDKDCATHVNDDFTKWGTDMASRMRTSRDESRPTEADAKRMTEVATAYGECMTSAMSASSVVPAPSDVDADMIDAATSDSEAPLPP